MKVVFVVQRYGTEVIGGAESLCRQVAERLTRDLSWDIEVWTTTAKDYRTWKNEYPKGVQIINGIKVVRFPVHFQRSQLIFNGINRILPRFIKFFSSRPGLLWRGFAGGLERLWFYLQGPVCPALLSQIKQQQEQFERFYFFTYLYYPTIMGLPLVPEKSVLVPMAHDEPPFYFPRVQKILALAPWIMVNTEPEGDLVKKCLSRDSFDKVVRAGLGIEDSFALATPVESDTLESSPTSLPQKPYLLYLGRIGRGKGCDVLMNWFLEFISSQSADVVHLVFAGKKDEDFEITKHPCIHDIGYVREVDKPALIANAMCLINPSYMESLSMIVLEAMALKVPVIVNGASDVLRFYCDHTDTAFFYRGKEDFFKILIKTIGLQKKKSQDWELKLTHSQRWVSEGFSWKNVLNRYTQSTRPSLREKTRSMAAERT